MIKQYVDDAVLSVATWLWGFLWRGALCWCVLVYLPLVGRQRCSLAAGRTHGDDWSGYGH